VSLAAVIALASTAVFCGLVLMSDRRRGALIAQGWLVLAAAGVFVAILAEGPVAGLAPGALAAFAVALIPASVAGMLYHLYLGRVDRVWAARGVFAAVYLGLTALFGFTFLSLI
jgi:hypothetical protein